MLFAFFATSGPSLFSQTATLGNLVAAPGEEVLVPLEFNGLQNVGAVSLFLIYDDNVAEFVDITNLSTEAAGSLANSLVIMDTTVVGMNWTAPGSSGINFPDGKFLDFRFNYINGTTQLSFFTILCEIVDFDLNVINIQYIDGSIVGNTGAAYSAWNGTGQWSDLQYWSNGVPGSSTHAVIQTGEVNIHSGAACNKLEILEGTSLAIYPGFFLSVFDSLTVVGNLSILSSEGGTGSLIARGEIVNNGNIHVERFLEGGANGIHLISAPVAGQEASLFGSSTVSGFNEPSREWANLAGTDLLGTGFGYRISVASDQTFTFQGNITNADTEVTLSFTEGGSADFPAGTNLAGNPFTSALDWNNQNWVKDNLYAAIYTMHNGRFISWNGETGSFEDGIIPAMQGFFVITGSDNTHFTIPESARVHSNQPYYKEAKEIENMLKLVLSYGDNEDHTYFQFKAGSSPKFDAAYDAFKFNGFASVAEIFSFTSEEVPLSINAFPTPAVDTAIPLGIRIPDQGEYKIVRSDFSIYTRPIYLKDMETGDTVNLKIDSVYSFTSDTGAFYERFRLYFAIPVSSIGELSFFDAEIYSFDGTVYINTANPLSDSYVEIYDLSGRIVKRAGLNHSASHAIETDPFLYPQIYIVRLVSGNVSLVRKVMISH